MVSNMTNFEDLKKELNQYLYTLESSALETSIYQILSLLHRDIFKTIEKAQENASGLGSFRELSAGCKILQKDCEKDTKFSRQNVTIPVFEGCKQILSLYDNITDVINSFMKKEFNDINAIEDASEKIIHMMNDLDELIDSVYSTKTDVTVSFMSNKFLYLMDEISDRFDKSKSSKKINIFYVVDTAKEQLEDDAIIVSAFNNLTDDEIDKSQREISNISYKKIGEGKNVVMKYKSVSLKLFGKMYGMVRHHVNNLTK